MSWPFACTGRTAFSSTSSEQPIIQQQKQQHIYDKIDQQSDSSEMWIDSVFGTMQSRCSQSLQPTRSSPAVYENDQFCSSTGESSSYTLPQDADNSRYFDRSRAVSYVKSPQILSVPQLRVYENAGYVSDHFDHRMSSKLSLNPVYDPVFSSPIMPKEKSSFTSRRCLVGVIMFLILLIVAIVTANALVAYYVLSYPRPAAPSPTQAPYISTNYPTATLEQLLGSQLLRRLQILGTSPVSNKDISLSSFSIPPVINFRKETTTSPPTEGTTRPFHLFRSTAPSNSIHRTTSPVPSTTELPRTTATTVPPTTSKSSKTTPGIPAWSNPNTNASCEKDQFKCDAGVSRLPCLFAWERCDGVRDCSDGSDEQLCDALQCYGNFQCADRTCVSLAKACNGIADCADGSDEEGCDVFQCKDYEFRCPSGYCIPQEWRCDGEADCPDHRDEYNCSITCREHELRCGEGWCIPKEWRCNGVIDCASGEDETDCECAGFTCASGDCVEPQNRCDGIPHCNDHSDEWGCSRLDDATGQLLIRKHGSEIYRPVCSDGWTEENGAQVCVHFGYSTVESMTLIPLDASAAPRVYKRTINIAHANSQDVKVQFMVEELRASHCESRQIVSLRCQTFQCGQWSSYVSPAPSPVRASPAWHTRSKRVVGGTLSSSLEWPSVGVLYHPQKRWACTATIIAPRWALTSALCVRRTDTLPFDWKFAMGASQRELRSIRQFIQHPSYKFASMISDYDALLVQLDEDVDATPMCLPSHETEDDTLCTTAGYGYTTPGGYNVNTELMQIDMLKSSQTECNSTQHYNGKLTTRMLCADSQQPNAGPCFNDEGSPLMCQDAASGSWYLAGLLTGQTCGSLAQHPSVFADVFVLRDWISNTVGFMN